MMKPPLTLIHFKKLAIFEQLQIEEALLRTSDASYCLINEGTSPAIVMGLSNHPKELLDVNSVRRDKIPVIKRFSGGGTVFVDEETLFVTFIMQKKALSIPLFPQAILTWAESFYRPVFNRPDFSLLENDFILGEKKMGGNAKYIRQNAFLLHTSFLWDFNEANMNYLLLPNKRPSYRHDRPHNEFLMGLNRLFSNKASFLSTLTKELHHLFAVTPCDHEKIAHSLTHPHRKTTTFVTI